MILKKTKKTSNHNEPLRNARRQRLRMEAVSSISHINNDLSTRDEIYILGAGICSDTLLPSHHLKLKLLEKPPSPRHSTFITNPVTLTCIAPRIATMGFSLSSSRSNGVMTTGWGFGPFDKPSPTSTTTATPDWSTVTALPMPYFDRDLPEYEYVDDTESSTTFTSDVLTVTNTSTEEYFAYETHSGTWKSTTTMEIPYSSSGTPCSTSDTSYTSTSSDEPTPTGYYDGSADETTAYDDPTQTTADDSSDSNEATTSTTTGVSTSTTQADSSTFYVTTTVTGSEEPTLVQIGPGVQNIGGSM